MSDQLSYPVRYLRAGLWRVHPELAQSASFAAGVDLSFRCVPEALQGDAIAEAYAALLDQLDGLCEADALRLVNLVATTFVQDEQRERGRDRKKKLWRQPVGLDQLVSTDDPVRAAELAQTEAAIKQLILSQPADARQAMAMLADENATPAERSVRHITKVTGLPRRTVASLQKLLERVASGLDLHDSGTGLSPGTGAAVGFGKLSAAVMQRSVTPATNSDRMAIDFEPKPKRNLGKNRFE